MNGENLIKYLQKEIKLTFKIKKDIQLKLIIKKVEDLIGKKEAEYENVCL